MAHLKNLTKLVSISELEKARDEAHACGMILSGLLKKGKKKGKVDNQEGTGHILKHLFKHPKRLHISDLYLTPQKIARLDGMLVKRIAHSGGRHHHHSHFLKKIGKFTKKASKSAAHTLRKFVNGETKLKPSKLLDITSKVADVASVVALASGHPEVAQGIEMAGKISGKSGKLLHSVGRGVVTAGNGLRTAGRGKVGSKRDVWNGVSIRTSGGLTKSQLMKNKRGKIVSKKRHEQGKRMYKNISKYSYRRKGKKASMPPPVAEEEPVEEES